MLWDFFNTGRQKTVSLIEPVQARRTFDDVILPERTRRQLKDALTQIDKHHLIFEQWGLGQRHTTGLGLGFNFAGPPGTGKTLCAEALAHALSRPLAVVRYSQLESMWAGESGKNVTAVFREAAQQNAVLFFDEADAVASRRITGMATGYEREANQVINILLKELEDYEGVVIFATNLATNFDPAFERRIRTHIYFELPGPAERTLIWEAQLSRRTPLADDVDFVDLAERYEMTGGDIKNAVIKAAQMAAGEEGPDAEKRIHQRHFEQASEEVLDARRVMQQSLFEENSAHPFSGLPDLYNSSQLAARVEDVETTAIQARQDALDLQSDLEQTRKALVEVDEAWVRRWQETEDGWTRRWTDLETRLARGVWLPVPSWVAGGTVGLVVALAGALAFVLLR